MERREFDFSREMIEKGAGPDWVKPTFESEDGEFERTAEEKGLEVEVLRDLFEKAELEELSEDDWSRLENADSRDSTWTLEEIQKHLKEKRDFDKIVEGFKKGDEIPAPIVWFCEGKNPYLIAGNSRLLACRGLDVAPKILALREEIDNKREL